MRAYRTTQVCLEDTPVLQGYKAANTERRGAGAGRFSVVTSVHCRGKSFSLERSV